MRITQDKFNETRHHYWRLNGIMHSILVEKSFSRIVDMIMEFRYELNSFVNSHRATTFTLQAEHKSKLGIKFNFWYEGALKPLLQDDFSKILKELRNINQKEGNLYPTFVFKTETDKAILYYEIDFTAEQHDYIINKRCEPKMSISVDLSDGCSNDDPRTITDEDRAKIMKAVAAFCKEQEAQIREDKTLQLYSLKIERLGQEFNPSDFLQNLKRVTKILQDIVNDGWRSLTP